MEGGGEKGTWAVNTPTLIWLGGPELREKRQREYRFKSFPGMATHRIYGHLEWLASLTVIKKKNHPLRQGRAGVSHVEFTIYLSTLMNKHSFVLAPFPALQTEATLFVLSYLFIFKESVSLSGFRVPVVVQMAGSISNPGQSMDAVIYSFNKEWLNVPLWRTLSRFWESDGEKDREGAYPWGLLLSWGVQL